MKRKLNILICVLFVGLLSGFCIAFRVLPDRAVSENENRTLRQLPTPTLSGCLNGSFTAAFTDYCSDQFPLRDECIRLAATMELALGRGESGGVLWINDSKATNVDSVYYALESMTRPVVWIAGGTD